MNILALESSCDETAAAVVCDGRTVRSNAVRSQIDLHASYGGVVPEIASRAHTEAISVVTQKALKDACLSLSDVDAVAVTACPGLVGALLVGVSFAKSLAYANDLPLIPVNHLRGHIAAAYLSYPDLKPPFYALVLSGGHTFLCEVEDYTRYRTLGATHDDAAGEAFDKVGRVIGLDYPGGKALQALADGYEHTDFYSFPLPILRDTEYDFSFSGLKTAVLNEANHVSQRGEVLDRARVAASFSHAVSAGVADRLSHLFVNERVGTLVFAGGVAANTKLRSTVDALCQQSGVRFCPVDPSFCGDNAAMIGAQGYYEFQNGTRADLSLNASPRAGL